MISHTPSIPLWNWNTGYTVAAASIQNTTFLPSRRAHIKCRCCCDKSVTTFIFFAQSPSPAYTLHFNVITRIRSAESSVVILLYQPAAFDENINFLGFQIFFFCWLLRYVDARHLWSSSSPSPGIRMIHLGMIADLRHGWIGECMIETGRMHRSRYLNWMCRTYTDFPFFKWNLISFSKENTTYPHLTHS